MNPLLKGAIAGTLATIPMTLVMSALFRRLPREQRYPLPPVLLTFRLARTLPGAPALEGRQLTATALAAHFAYGALTGAIYPLFARTRLVQSAPLLMGPAYGLGVWAASYLGWIPAARLLAPATRHPARRNVLMGIAHVVWGAALAAAFERLAGSDRAALRPGTLRVSGNRAPPLDPPGCRPASRVRD